MIASLRSKWWLIAGLALLVSALLWWQFAASKNRVNWRIAVARSAGYPITLIELNQWYKTPPINENAALTIMEAATYRRSAGSAEDSLQLSDARFPLTSDTMDVLRDILDLNKETLDLLHRASLLPRSRYPLDLTQGSSLLLPSLAKIKGLVQLLRYAAIWHAEKGETAQAVENILESIAVTRSLEEEPLLISQLVRIATLAITENALERVLNRAKLSDAQLQSLDHAFSEAESRISNAQIRALVGERCLGTDFFQTSSAKRAAMNNSGGANKGQFVGLIFDGARRITGLHDRDFTVYWDEIEAGLRATKLPFPAQVSAAAKLQNRDIPKWCLFSRMIMPAVTKSLLKHAREVAKVRMTRVALEIERYALAHEGKLPPALDALVPDSRAELPRDPYTGGNFQYLPTDNGYVLYSDGFENENRDGKKVRELTFTASKHGEAVSH